MGGSGEISIRAARTDAGGVAVTICDTGPGIPPETVPKLFEPFFTTKPLGMGTGLGLHLSHNIVVRHGGAIEVESEPGKTCFEVTLPPVLPRPRPTPNSRLLTCLIPVTRRMPDPGCMSGSIFVHVASILAFMLGPRRARRRHAGDGAASPIRSGC